MADNMSIDSKLNANAGGIHRHPGSEHHHHHHHDREHSHDSADSTPDQEHHGGAAPAGNGGPQDQQQPRRKGGRKPIYATSEERKQRNRQAQAAFRERRTEYIKQLEETIRVHESNLHNLQGAHRSAADECLMLRYKNSLLERILLEKGIDVQAELRAKTGSPNLGPTHVPPNMVQPPPIQRAIMNRHHSRRSKSNSTIAPKADSGTTSGSTAPHSTSTSPKNSRPTPSSHSNSPNTTGSGFSPSASENVSVRGSVGASGRPQMPQATGAVRQQSMQQNSGRSAPPATSNAAAFYPTPAFQNHIKQLEQEYDAQDEMIEDSEMETPGGPGPYPMTFSNGGNDAQQQVFPSPTSDGRGHHIPRQNPQPQVTNAQYPSMTQLLDQNLDWDPFGLSASMAFPAQHYQPFDQTNMR